MPIWRAARSTISSASRCRRCCGANCRARARPAACNRSRCGWSADRELEIEKFVRQEYWSLVATLATPREETFEARLVGADGKKLQRLDIGSGAEAEAFKQALETAAFTVSSVEAKPVKRHPYPPFTTSTLQQEASRKLGFAPAHTMRVAQRLYEGVDIGGETIGLITYMRTDGVQIAEEAIGAVRSLIESDYGRDYVPGAPRRYETKAKNAQEAHEAIRPTELAAPAARNQELPRCRPGQALRTDLAAHRGEPDGIRRARAHHRRNRSQGRQAAFSTCAQPERW